jgi:hypothetical protein
LSTVAAIHPRPRRRLPVGKIVLLAVGLAVVVEPLLMYHTLLRQREARAVHYQAEHLFGGAPDTGSLDGGR